MSRVVRFVAAYGEFSNGDVVEIDDQLAVSVLAQGYAVPCIDALPVAVAAPEAAAFDEAPENVAADAAPDTPAAEAAPENVAAPVAPDVA